MQRLATVAAIAVMLGAAPALAGNAISTEGLKASPNSVKVRAVTADKAGYIVVHEADQKGAAGEVLGLKAIEEGENGSLSIPLGKRMKPGARLIVMLHEESNGDSRFDDADAPAKAANGPVQQTVTVE